MDVSIIYFSSTGNTADLATIISDYYKGAASVSTFDSVDQNWENSDLIFLGTPAQGTEEVDDTNFLPFIESNFEKLSNKKIIFFGSYGWGGGQYLNDFAEQCKSNGLNIVTVITQEENPDSQTFDNISSILSELNL